VSRIESEKEDKTLLRTIFLSKIFIKREEINFRIEMSVFGNENIEAPGEESEFSNSADEIFHHFHLTAGCIMVL